MRSASPGAADRLPNARRLAHLFRKQWQFHAAVHNLLKLHRNGGLAHFPSG